VINGGANRERNLHPLCEWCEPPKTEADEVTELSQAASPRWHQSGAEGASASGNDRERVEAPDGWWLGAAVHIAQVRAMKAQGLGASEIARELKIGRTSVYRVLEGG
jgi:hypothetical protein